MAFSDRYLLLDYYLIPNNSCLLPAEKDSPLPLFPYSKPNPIGMARVIQNNVIPTGIQYWIIGPTWVLPNNIIIDVQFFALIQNKMW